MVESIMEMQTAQIQSAYSTFLMKKQMRNETINEGMLRWNKI